MILFCKAIKLEDVIFREILCDIIRKKSGKNAEKDKKSGKNESNLVWQPCLTSVTSVRCREIC